MNTLPISFEIVQLQADKRQYKTTMPLIVPLERLVVVVDVPEDHNLVYNLEERSLKLLSGEEPPKPTFTPKGLAFLEDALLNRIDNPDVKSNNNKSEYTDSDFVFEED